MRVLIIGGGPAGSVVAINLAKHFDVTLIQDKKWDKPCGGGIKRKILKKYNLENLSHHNLDYVEMIYKNKTIPISLKGKNLSIVIREEFDEVLRKKGEKNGAKLIYGRFSHFEDKKAVIKINNEKFLFEYDILIAADGVNSTVRKALNLKEIPKILTYYARSKDYLPKTCEFFFDRDVAGDYYAWAFPHINQGHIGCVDKNNFENLCKKLNVNVKEKGYFIPTWQENITIQKENIYFVGDAAGQVMPLSFEGIYYAMRSAEILADCIINKKDYKSEWERVYLKKFKFMKFLEKINKTSFRNIMVNLHKFKWMRDFSVKLWLG